MQEEILNTLSLLHLFQSPIESWVLKEGQKSNNLRGLSGRSTGESQRRQNRTRISSKGPGTQQPHVQQLSLKGKKIILPTSVFCFFHLSCLSCLHSNCCYFYNRACFPCFLLWYGKLYAFLFAQGQRIFSLIFYHPFWVLYVLGMLNYLQPLTPDSHTHMHHP